MRSRFAVLSVNSSTDNLRLSIYDASPFVLGVSKVPLMLEFDITPAITYNPSNSYALIYRNPFLYLKIKSASGTEYKFIDQSLGNSTSILTLDNSYTASVLGYTDSPSEETPDITRLFAIRAHRYGQYPDHIFISNTGANFEYQPDPGSYLDYFVGFNGDTINNNTNDMQDIPEQTGSYDISYDSYSIKEQFIGVYGYSLTDVAFEDPNFIRLWFSYNFPYSQYSPESPEAGTSDPRGFCTYTDRDNKVKLLYWELIGSNISTWTETSHPLGYYDPLIYTNKIFQQPTSFALDNPLLGFQGAGGQISCYNTNALFWEYIPTTLSELLPISDVLTAPIAVAAYNLPKLSDHWTNKIQTIETLIEV